MKKSTRNKVNLIFSSFLVIGYIVCSFFFSSLVEQFGGDTGNMVQCLILVVFGLLLFYATRVGEGRQVKRFSIAVLLLLVVPSAYIIAASFVPQLPFHDQLEPITATLSSGKSALFQPMILMLACVGIGYGLPYTFLAGYEMETDDEEEEGSEPAEESADESPIEGGIAAELAEAAAEEAEEAAEETAEKAEEAAADAAEEAKEAAEAVEEAEETAEKAEEAAGDAAEEVKEAAAEAAESAKPEK